MTDVDDIGNGGGELTAGAMLRAARERLGLHIAVLAATIKVSPRKLDALENDRYAELPDATFVRALAQTMCRALKIDPQPVLARLPQVSDSGLDLAAGGLNAPFRDRPGRHDPGAATWAQRPLLWAGALLLLAAAAIALVPTGVWRVVAGDGESAPAGASPVPASTATTAQPAASVPAMQPAASAPVVESIHAVPSDPAASAVASSAPLVTTTDASWIEAIDANDQVLLSRIVPPGETVRLEGALPIRFKVGNARATQIVFRGQPVDLAPSTRDNVARLELK